MVRVGQALKNWMLHEIDFAAEVEQIWRSAVRREVPVTGPRLSVQPL